jgi:type II secretory pathway component GspD/PulD (secretin)
MKTLKLMPVALALSLFLVPVSFAQQPASTPRPEPDYVTEKGFKSRVFDVKYRDATSLAQVLRNLGSGFKGATLQSNSEFKTITVRDFPENLATMEEAIKRLDAAATPRPNIELHFHVLIASNAGTSTPDMPAELKEVLTQLRGTLNYRNYELVASIVQRLTETRELLQGSGVAEVPALNPSTPNISTPYEYYLRNVSLVANLAGAPTVQINEFSFKTQTSTEQSRIQTALNLKDGEKVVVGTATLRNRALVLVLTANVLK